MRKEVTFTSPVFQSAKKDLETSFQVDLESGEDDEALQDALSEEDDDGLTRGFSSCEVSSEGEDAGLRRRVVKRDSFKDAGPTSKRQCPRMPTKESFSESVQMGNVPSQNFSFGVQRTGPDLTNQQRLGTDLANQHAGFQRIVEAIADPDNVSRSIKLSASQMAIYCNISKGKCANGAVAKSAQMFAESFQSLDFGFVWYPFLCVGMLTFDFQRTISITMFQYEEWFTVAKRTNSIDMADFGRKAKTVPAPVLNSIAQLVGCVGQLLRVCQMVYVNPLVEAVDALRSFLMTQECMEADMGPEPIPTLVIWVNNRLGAIRQAFELDSPSRLQMVVESFDTAGSEYRRAMQECENKKWRAFQSSILFNKGKSGGDSDRPKKDKKDRGKRRGHEKLSDADRAKSKELFDICFKGMPKDGDKNVCFHNLTTAGCKVKACRLSHKLVSKGSLPDTVVEALTSLYGALRADLP